MMAYINNQQGNNNQHKIYYEDIDINKNFADFPITNNVYQDVDFYALTQTALNNRNII